MSKVLGAKMFSKEMIDSFNTLLKEEAWRVRLSVYELMGEIGKTFGRKQFEDTLEALFLKFLNDKAAAVREVGYKKSAEIADHFGQEWVTDKLLPKAFESYSNPELSYLC